MYFHVFQYISYITTHYRVGDTYIVSTDTLTPPPPCVFRHTVVDVRMCQQRKADVAGIEGKWLVVQVLSRTVSLKKAAIDKKTTAVAVDQRTRSSHRASRATKSESRHRIQSFLQIQPPPHPANRWASYLRFLSICW